MAFIEERLVTPTSQIPKFAVTQIRQFKCDLRPRPAEIGSVVISRNEEKHAYTALQKRPDVVQV